MKVRRKKIPTGFQELKEPEKEERTINIAAAEAVRKIALHRKACGECGHLWTHHWAKECQAKGIQRVSRCLCAGFKRREGDSL
jgi:hypothetical protein